MHFTFEFWNLNIDIYLEFVYWRLEFADIYFNMPGRNYNIPEG